MEEYVTDAIVLVKTSSGEKDGRYVLFTERFGKLAAKAKSSRQITSKLAGHLEPGVVAKVRFIDKGSAQVVDALKYARIDLSPQDLKLLSDLLSDMQVERELWTDLTGHSFSWSRVLKMLGWDPNGALCVVCENRASSFLVSRQEFVCDTCVLKMGKSKISYIRVDAPSTPFQ